MNTQKWLPAAGLLLSVGTLPAQAALLDRGNGLIYDDALNVTWLQDANLFKSQYAADNSIVGTIIANVGSVAGHALTTNDFNGSSGKMTWWGAQAWAANLSYGGYDDWRLPKLQDCNYANCGYIVPSELAQMYFNLGLKSYFNASGAYQPDFGVFGNGTYNGTDKSSYGQKDVGLIDNLQAYLYWLGSEFALDSVAAWHFDTNYGNQSGGTKNYQLYAWAVRSGDVVAPGPSNPVPEPGSVALLSAGLLAWRRMARRR